MLKGFNNWLGDKLAYWLSTMAMFYIITALVLIPLAFQRPDGLVGWMQYTISVFFQGAALPVLGYVAGRAGERQEKMLNETHDTVMEELTLIKEELALAREQRDELEMLLANLRMKTPDTRTELIGRKHHENREIGDAINNCQDRNIRATNFTFYE